MIPLGSQSRESSWWHVDQLTRNNVRIIISVRDTIMNEFDAEQEVDELVGMRRVYTRPREIVWTTPRPGDLPVTRSARSKVVWSVVRQDGRLQDLPPHAFPTFWRPTNLANWPDPLPEPYPIRTWTPPPKPAPEAGEPASKTDAFDWRGPYNVAGSIGVREAEVRLIRGLRTHGTRNLNGTERLIVGAYVDSVVLVSRGVALAPEWKDPSDARAIPVKWEATRQDISDEPIVMDWYRMLSPQQQAVVRQRAQLPAWSFRQISEAPGSKFRSWAHARDTYNAAIARVTRIANEGV